MSYRISCYTLFDITQTGVLNRNIPTDLITKELVYKRSTQANFDTLLQVINLRSQPESISSPRKLDVRFDEFTKFGTSFKQYQDKSYPCWRFKFDIFNHSVFNMNDDELGALYHDCHNVPMIICGTEFEKLPNFLDTDIESRNIYFEVDHE